MPRTRSDLLASAYSALGVNPNSVLIAPKIVPDLLSLGIDLPHALRLLRSSAAPEARQVISYYDDPALSSTYRRILPLEAFCVACAVCPTRVLEVIVSSERRLEALRGAVIAARQHPAIVKLSTEQALLPEGIEDRGWQLKNMSFLPMPKGSQVNVNVSASATSASVAQSTAIPAPSPESTIRRMVNRFNDSRPPAELPATIDAETIPDFSAPAPSTDLVPIPAHFIAADSSSDDDGEF